MATLVNAIAFISTIVAVIGISVAVLLKGPCFVWYEFVVENG
jgi:hypothetical protein